MALPFSFVRRLRVSSWDTLIDPLINDYRKEQMRKISATTPCILGEKGIERFGDISRSSRYLYDCTLNCVTEWFGEGIKLLFRVSPE